MSQADYPSRARSVYALLSHRNEFTIGWCAAFMQWGRIHVVQRAEVRP